MDVEQVLKESAASFKAAMLVVEQARATIASLEAKQAKLNNVRHEFSQRFSVTRLKLNIEESRTQLDAMKERCASSRSEAEVTREAVLGVRHHYYFELTSLNNKQDQKALAAICLRQMFDRVLMDIFDIAGMPFPINRQPTPDEGRQAFHVAKERLDSQTQLDIKLQDFSAILSGDNFLSAHFLIFCQTSNLRAIVKQRAHATPSPQAANNSDVVLNASCPADLVEVIRLCVSAYKGYRSEADRALERNRVELAQRDIERKKCRDELMSFKRSFDLRQRLHQLD